jgi:hypothetical protein
VNNRIAVLVVLLFLLQHPGLMLVFKQKLYRSLARWLGRLASFFSFQWQLLSHLLPQWGVAVWMCILSSGSGKKLCSPPAILLWTWVFAMLVYWGACFFASPPFSGARSDICQPAPCCQHVMLVCWLFFTFAALFDFGCCSLAQEMSFADHYLVYFRQRLITHLLSTLLYFPSLFTKSYRGEQLLAPPPFSDALRAPRPSAVCSFSVLCLLFSWFFFFVAGGGGQSVQGAMLVYPKGGCGNTTWCLFAHLLVCQMSPKQVWSGV